MSNQILANISVLIPINGGFRKPARNPKANSSPEAAVQNISDRSLPVIFLQGQRIQGSDIRKIDTVSSSSCKAHSPATSIMSETETRATCAEDGLFFFCRRCVSAPLPQSYFESPELGHLNKKLQEIKEKSSDILDRLDNLSQNDKDETCSDIFFYPSEISDEDIEDGSTVGLNPPTPPLRRSYSKPEFTYKESLLREFQAIEARKFQEIDSERDMLQTLIENLLTDVVQFVKVNDDLGEIENIKNLIISIEDLDEESLRCPEDLEGCLDKAKLEVDSVIKKILNNELFSFSLNTPAISESSDDEEYRVGYLSHNALYGGNSITSYDTPRESSESSDSVGYLSHIALYGGNSITSYDTPSESSESSDDVEYSVGYLSRIAGSVRDSKNKNKVLNIMQLFEGIQNLHSQRDILDFDELTYLKKALKDLQQKFIKMSKPAV